MMKSSGLTTGTLSQNTLTTSGSSLSRAYSTLSGVNVKAYTLPTGLVENAWRLGTQPDLSLARPLNTLQAINWEDGTPGTPGGNTGEMIFILFNESELDPFIWEEGSFDIYLEAKNDQGDCSGLGLVQVAIHGVKSGVALDDIVIEEDVKFSYFYCTRWKRW